MAFYSFLLISILGFSMVIADGGYGHGYGYKAHPISPAHGVKTPAPRYGHYHYTKTTCADHYKPGITNGHYKVYSVYHMGAMKVYCDFETEPGMAYTMVMASSLAGRTDSTVAVSGEERKNPFIDVGLSLPESTTIKHHVNSNIPNKVAYRQAKVDMDRISKASKVWRMVCETPATPFIDYIRAKLSVVNPLTLSTTTDKECFETEYLNLGGKTCVGCEANILQRLVTVAAVGSDPEKPMTILNVGKSNECQSPSTSFADDDVLMPSTVVSDSCSGDIKLWFGKPVH